MHMVADLLAPLLVWGSIWASSSSSSHHIFSFSYFEFQARHRRSSIGEDQLLLWAAHAIQVRGGGRQTQVPVCPVVLVCLVLFCFTSVVFPYCQPWWPTAMYAHPQTAETRACHRHLHQLTTGKSRMPTESLSAYYLSWFCFPNWTLSDALWPAAMALSD